MQPRGVSDAIIWEGGSAHGGVKPVAHALTDMFSLNGTIMALDVLGLPFLVDMAGNALNLYDSVEWWDDANHLVNWALHTAAIAFLLRVSTLKPWARAFVAIGWAAATAILWELGEYVAFVPNSPEAATAYVDTLGDLALGLLGGTLAAVAIAWWRSHDDPVRRGAGWSR